MRGDNADRWTRSWRAWLISAVVAALAAGVAGWLVWTPASERPPRMPAVTHDRVRQAAQELEQREQANRELIYIAPDARALISRADERQLESTMRDSPVPIIFVGWQAAPARGLHIYGHAEMAAAVGKPGFYVIWDGPGNFRVQGMGTSSSSTFDVSEAGDPVARMKDLVTGLQRDDPEVGTRRDLIDDVAGPKAERARWVDQVGLSFLGLFIGAVGGLVAAGVAFALVAWWSAFRIKRLRRDT